MHNVTLTGKKFISTRPANKSTELAKLVQNAGASLHKLPLIEVNPAIISSGTKHILEHLNQYQWLILTSANAVFYFMDAGKNIAAFSQAIKHINIAAIGSKTAKTIEQWGYKVSFTPSKAESRTFAREFREHIHPNHSQVLWPTSNLSDNFLVDALQPVAQVKKITMYQTTAPQTHNSEILEMIKQNNYDLIYFFSPSACENLYKIMQPHFGTNQIRAASIGPATTACMHKLGITPLFEAKTQNTEGLFQATLNYYKTKHQ